MIDLNIGNFVTIGLISVIAFAAIQWAMQQFGLNIPFLTM
jgi:hypothetical protein